MTSARRVAGVSVAWIVPFFLGAIMFPGPALAETVRTSGSFGTSTLALVVSEKRRIRMLSLSGATPTTKSVREGRCPYSKTFSMVTRQSPEGKAILSRPGHVPLP